MCLIVSSISLLQVWPGSASSMHILHILALQESHVYGLPASSVATEGTELRSACGLRGRAPPSARRAAEPVGRSSLHLGHI